MSVTEFSRGADSYRFIEDSKSDCVTELFDPAWLRQTGALHETNLKGRGAVYVFDHQATTYLLRKYYRGGLVRYLSTDTFHWTGLAKTRPWREFTMLVELQHQGLPGPRPYACRVTRSGMGYTGSVITQLIPDTQTLADKLCHVEVPENEWFAIGLCIRRFHDAGVCHSDLNAHNILINKSGKIHLIDFDKSSIRRGHGRPWKFANLKRLQRSIMKCWTKADVFFFSPQSWETLRDGYLSNGQASPDTPSR